MQLTFESPTAVPVGVSTSVQETTLIEVLPEKNLTKVDALAECSSKRSLPSDHDTVQKDHDYLFFEKTGQKKRRQKIDRMN